MNRKLVPIELHLLLSALHRLPNNSNVMSLTSGSKACTFTISPWSYSWCVGHLLHRYLKSPWEKLHICTIVSRRCNTDMCSSLSREFHLSLGGALISLHLMFPMWMNLNQKSQPMSGQRNHSPSSAKILNTHLFRLAWLPSHPSKI